MSGTHRRTERTPFLGFHHNQRPPLSAVEMTTPEPPPLPRRSISLGVDVGTGSARAGRFSSLASTNRYHTVLTLCIIFPCLCTSFCRLCLILCFTGFG